MFFGIHVLERSGWGSGTGFSINANNVRILTYSANQLSGFVLLCDEATINFGVYVGQDFEEVNQTCFVSRLGTHQTLKGKRKRPWKRQQRRGMVLLEGVGEGAEGSKKDA